MIEPVGAGGGGQGDRCPAVFVAGESDYHAANGSFAGVAHPVVVGIHVGVSRDDRQVDDAGIEGQIGLPRPQCGRSGKAGHFVEIGVSRVRTDVGRGQGKSARNIDTDFVDTGNEVSKLICADTSGEHGDGVARSIHHCASCGVEQVHANVGHAGLAGILNAVAVEVLPDPVSERGEAIEAGVNIGARHTTRHVHNGGRTRAYVRVGVCGSETISGGGQIPSRPVRCGEANAVCAGGEASKEIGTTTCRRLRGDHGSRTVEQFDGDAVETGLSRVLNPVGVGVVPYPVTDAGGPVETSVHMGGGHAIGHGERIRCPGNWISVGVQAA